MMKRITYLFITAFLLMTGAVLPQSLVRPTFVGNNTTQRGGISPADITTDTTQPANQRRWLWAWANGVMHGQVSNDNGSTPVDWITVTRSGDTITSILFPTVSTTALISSANGYHNFGSTVGSAGYGFRDNAGTMEWKNNLGTWQSISTPAPTGGGWTRISTTISPLTGSDTVSVPTFTSAQAVGSATLGTELNSNVAGWTTGTAWSNSGGGLYTCAGTCGTLTSPSVSVTSGTHYLITWRIGQGTYSAADCGTFTLTLGAVASPSYLFSCSDTGVFPRAADIIAGTTGSVTLVMTPGSDFKGRIDQISLKAKTSDHTPAFVQTDASGTSLEARSSSTLVTSGVGLNALQSNASTVAGDFGTTGTGNHASGPFALKFNTLGYSNSAFGPYALQNNTVGMLNAASGYGSLQNNTIGFRNSAFGFKSLFSNTKGYLNSAFSDEALYANTTGTNNTAMGVSACQDGTTASFNTCTGVAALNLNTTGSDNVADGVSAMQNTTSGDLNTAVGTGSMQGQNNDGSVPATNVMTYNTSVGGNSLFFLKGTTTSDARENVAVGFYAGNDFYDAGNNNKHPVSETQMTFLGAGATKNSASVLTNGTALGFRAFVTKSNQQMFGNSSVAEWNFGTQYALTQDTGRLGASGFRLQCQALTNNDCWWTLVPNGTNKSTGARLYDSSDTANAGAISISIDGTAHTASIDSNSWGTGTAPTLLHVTGMVVQMDPVTFAGLPTCSLPADEGKMRPIKDSSTNTFNAVITGGGANHGLALCDGTNWRFH